MPYAIPAFPPHSYFMFEGRKRDKQQMEARQRMAGAQRDGAPNFNSDGKARERVLALRDKGLTYKQVAAELGMPVSACEYYGRKQNALRA